MPSSKKKFKEKKPYGRTVVTKIENFVMKGKKLTSLDRKPKDFRHKALFVFFASCFIVVFVFFKLWLWPGILR